MLEVRELQLMISVFRVGLASLNVIFRVGLAAYYVMTKKTLLPRLAEM